MTVFGKRILSQWLRCRMLGRFRIMRNAGKNAIPLGVYRALRENRVAKALRYDKRLGREDARLRYLPPPFIGWCTVSSDADSPNMEGFLSAGHVIREQLALPICDSTFPHFIFNQGLKPGKGYEAGFPDFGCGDIFELETFVVNSFEWLRQTYKGRVDTVHGWLLRQQIRISEDFVYAANRSWLRCKLLGNKFNYLSYTRKRLKFHVPEGWHLRVPPRYLVFNYRALSSTCIVKLVFLDADKEVGEVNITEPPGAAMEILTPYVVDMQKIVGKDPELLRRVDVEVHIQGESDLIEIRKPMMVSWLREEIQEQVYLFAAFNLRFSTYTSHGGGYNIGHYRSKRLASADPRGMAELDENPHFALDLFKEYGMRFFNTANNTSQRDLLRLPDLIFPRVINNGEVVYDFNRYLNIPKDKLGYDDYEPFKLFGKLQNPSLANFAGWQLDTLTQQIDACEELGMGGAVYTHLLSKCQDDPERFNRSVEGLFSDDTRAALERLAGRYYGLDAADSNNRIFVAPLALLLRYAQVLSNLQYAAVYDVKANVIRVRGWRDVVTGEYVPDDIGGTDSLRYATFYVDEAASARLFVDGVEHKALMRNADDGIGGESITVIAADAPTHIAGSIPLTQRPDRIVKSHGCSLSADEHGEGNIVQAYENEAKLIIETQGVSLADHSSVRVELSGDLHEVSWRIEMETSDGCVFGFAVGDDACHAGLAQALSGPDPGHHDVVIPFYRLVESAKTKRFPGQTISRLLLTVYGAKERTLALDAISLLRDDPRVKTDDCIVGGRMAEGLDMSRVIMSWDDNHFEAPVLREGWYVFLDPVPRGTVISLHAQSDDASFTVFPDCGPRFEVHTDTLDVIFSGEAQVVDGREIN